MAVFLNQERTKIGTTTGTIIAFPVEFDVNDPLVGLSKSLLPSGYVRCDGSVYNEALFPALAEILGTGDACAFRQPDQELLDTQFQVPDLRSKFIKPSTGSDQGVLNDLEVTTSSGLTVAKSGVGVEVSSNVGTTAVVELTGQFRIPERTVKVNNNVGFTYPSKPDEEVVAANSFLPHAHYSTTYRCRTIRAGGSDTFEQNYFTNASTVGVLNWYDSTSEQPACYHYAQSQVWGPGNYIPDDDVGGIFVNYEYFGICKGSCDGFIDFCLVPQGRSYAVDGNDITEGPCYQNIAFSIIRDTMPCPKPSFTVAANYVQGGSSVGNDSIPTGAGSSGGAIQGFSLFENYQTTDGVGYYTKGLGQWALSNYGSALWSDLSDFATGEVDLQGGTGTGARAVVRFEAYPGGGGNPGNSRYKIISWVSTGTGYTGGDILTFPDLGGYAIGSALLPDGTKAFRLQVDSTTFSSPNDAAGYAHNTSLHNVVPFDTVTDNVSTQAFAQISNIIETTESFEYEEDPTEHTHTIAYSFGATNFDLNIPELFISTDGMEASVNITPDNVSKIDSLIAPFTMVEFLIKV